MFLFISLPFSYTDGEQIVGIRRAIIQNSLANDIEQQLDFGDVRQLLSRELVTTIEHWRAFTPFFCTCETGVGVERSRQNVNRSNDGL